jgi:glycosyltransferase involved in cell wall biosynthesis
MARIMHVITSLTTGGAEMMLLKLLSATNGRHAQAVVSLMDEGATGAHIANLGVPVRSLGMRRAAPNPLRALSIRFFARQFDPDLILGWMYHGNLMASLAGLSSRKETPVLWGIRSSLYDLALERRLTGAVIRLGALLSRRPVAIIYNSRTSAQQHEALGYCLARQVVIPNGFDCQMFCPDQEARGQVRSELGVGENAILVGLVARYHPMKDHPGFLRAAALVAEAHPSVRFVLIGRGLKEQPALLALITELRMQDRFFLLGERHDIPRLTAALDVACSASAWGEGFSNAIGEAMACGVPCVVTDVGDSAYIVGGTGACVPPRHPEALAQAILQLISAGPEGRRQLGTAARRRIQDKFSLPAVVRQYEDLYSEHLTPAI